VHTYNPSTWEVEAGGLWVWDQHGLHKLKASLSYRVRFYLKKRRTERMCSVI
jgi:hypothetical protein